MATTESTWTPGSWRGLPALQQPAWPDPSALEAARTRLGQLPPLVFAGEARALRESLGEAAEGRAFVLQAGDCAESFRDVSAVAIRERLKVLLQMSAVLTYGATLPVVKIGRIAGQFAKPRSSDTEVVDGVELPSFRGHAVHSDEATVAARQPDPERLIQAYYQAVSTLNLLRAFTKGGFADLTQVHTWNQEFVASSIAGQRYEGIANEIGRALRFMQAIGIDLGDERSIHEVDIWTCHEALLLDYEEPLVRKDSTTGDWYACSAHFLWAGERTRQLDGAHVEFLSGVHNPIGSKVGPEATPDELVALVERLNPDRIPGRITLIARLGADRVRELLPPLLRAVRETGQPVLWICDPMHANGFISSSGHKTRRFDDILREIEGFFAAHREVGTWPGGVHLEITGEDVTECLGGSHDVSEEQLEHRYETLCDPRLNVRQSLDLAFRVAELVEGLDVLAVETLETGGSKMVKRLSVIGTGLIGASAALAARRAGVETVTGWDPDAEALSVAAENGAVTAAPSLGEALAEAELVIVAAPVAELPELVKRVLEHAPADCAITDVGSTKGSIVGAAAGDGRFIGGHPICGAETRGPGRATAELFDGATWFLTPVAATPPERFRMLHAFVAGLGARPVAIDPGAHDRLVAVTSHLPHALSNALINQAGAARVDGHDPLQAAGGSLRDMTRIAGANPRIWVDIFLDNKEAVLAALGEHRRRVEQFEMALRDGDAGFIARWIGEAGGNRRRMLATAYDDPGALQRLRVHIPDRPGVLAGIFQALGAERINVADFEFEHLSHDRGGTLTILVAGTDEAQRTADLLEAQGYGAVVAPVIEE